MIRVHGTIYEKNGEFYLCSDEKRVCPSCGEVLKYRDTKRRSLIDADGNVCIYHLRRYHCKVCNKQHLEIPDTMIPHRRYSRLCIEAAVAGNDEGCAAETSTIYRWRKAYSESTKEELR